MYCKVLNLKYCKLTGKWKLMYKDEQKIYWIYEKILISNLAFWWNMALKRTC